MAEQSLAVKYRPQKFDDLTEQESIKTILRYQLDTKTIKNCYLFHIYLHAIGYAKYVIMSLLLMFLFFV